MRTVKIVDENDLDRHWFVSARLVVKERLVFCVYYSNVRIENSLGAIKTRNLLILPPSVYPYVSHLSFKGVKFFCSYFG